MSKNNKFIYGFDYLRIILCIGVIALHSNIFTLANQYVGSSVNPLYYRVLLYNFFWVCVPTFMTLSLFLYIRKSYEDKNYYKKRLKQLIIIYLFWGLLELILHNYGNISFIKYLNIKDLLLLFISNGTIAYFLFNLIYMTIFTEILIRIYRKYKCKTIYYIFFIISLVLMFFSIFFVQKIGFSSDFSNKISFSNPLLFIPYSFSALYLYLVLEKRDTINIKKIIIWIICLFLVFDIFDWIIRSLNYDFLKYNYESLGRPSLVFESMLLIIIFSSSKIKYCKLVSKISNLTMGVFLIHTIVLNYLGLNIMQLNINVNGFVIFFITTLLSFLIIGIIKNHKYLL